MNDDFTADAKARAVPADCQKKLSGVLVPYGFSVVDEPDLAGILIEERQKAGVNITTDRLTDGELEFIRRRAEFDNLTEYEKDDFSCRASIIDRENHADKIIEAVQRAGVKYDSGKMRPTLVLDSFRKALKQVIEVGTFGANKYSDDGWKTVPNAKARYRDALYRHLMEDGNDPESNLSHLTHAAWNILALMELEAMDE